MWKKENDSKTIGGLLSFSQKASSGR